MIFNEVLKPDGHITRNFPVLNREAVRAVIIKYDKILMVRSNKGDYKLPGGGIEAQEDHVKAIKREVREETGYLVSKVSNKIGQVFEQKLDQFDSAKIFEMTSHYYTCEIKENIRLSLQLSRSETKLALRPTWISIVDAIKANNQVLNGIQNNINSWVNRESLVLRILKKHYSHLK